MAQRVDTSCQFTVLSQVNEQAVIPIDFGRAKRLQRDGQDTLPMFAARLGDDLLDPACQRGQRRVGQDRQLVAASESGFGQDGPQRHPRVARRRHMLPKEHRDDVSGAERSRSAAALTLHPVRAVEQAGQVHAEQSGRHHPEICQRREASADGSVRGENPAEAAFARQCFERGVRVGDGDEARAVAFAQVPEEIERRHHFGGPTRFAGGDVQTFLRRIIFCGFCHLRGVGGIENSQRDAPLFLSPHFLRKWGETEGGRGKKRAQHFGGQRRAAHAEHEGAVNAFFLDFIREGSIRGNLCARFFGRVQPAEAIFHFGLARGVGSPEGGVMLPEARGNGIRFELGHAFGNGTSQRPVLSGAEGSKRGSGGLPPLVNRRN